VTLTAAGGTGPYTWGVSSGTLPGGLELSSTGVLSGLPTTAGTTTFTVRVTDADLLTATKQFSVTVIDLVITKNSVLVPGVKGVPYATTFTATGGNTAGYVWSLAPANPPGLTFVGGVLSGTPTTAGQSNFTVTLSDGAATVTKAFSLNVTATYVKPVVDPLNFGTTTVGLEYAYPLSAQNYPASFTVTGLPAGLKYVAKDKRIFGRATVGGVFQVKVKATNKAGTSTIVTAPLTVKALEDGLAGTFTGVIARDATANKSLGSRLSVTTAGTGFYTAKITTGATLKQMTGYLNATAPQITVVVDGSPLSLTVDTATDLVSGTHGVAQVSGWRSVWDKTVKPATYRVGYYSAQLKLVDAEDIGSTTVPQGYGYATFSVDAAGSLTVAGKTADNLAISSAGFVGPNGEIAVYTSLYGNNGSVLGQWSLGVDSAKLFAGNTVSGALSWKKPATAGVTYPALFADVSLAVEGKYLAPAAKGYEVLGLPDAGTADVVFTGGGIGLSATVAKVTGFTYTDNNVVIMPTAGGVNNAAKAKLSINKATGAVSGSLSLLETSPVLPRTVNFYGQTVRVADGTTKAVGYFLLPQIPVPGSGQTAKTAPVYSGSFAIEQGSSAP